MQRPRVSSPSQTQHKLVSVWIWSVWLELIDWTYVVANQDLCSPLLRPTAVLLFRTCSVFKTGTYQSFIMSQNINHLIFKETTSYRCLCEHVVCFKNTWDPLENEEKCICFKLNQYISIGYCCSLIFMARHDENVSCAAGVWEAKVDDVPSKCSFSLCQLRSCRNS